MVKLRRALIASLAPGAVLALSLAGCGDLLGLKDLEPYPADGSADSSEDSSPDGTTGDTGMVLPDGTGGDARDAGTTDGNAGDGTTTTDSPGTDAPEDTSHPVDSSTGQDSSTSPDSSMGVDSSSGMDSSTVEDSSTAPDSSCTTGSQTDSHNCGSCGHDCLGGGCSGGLCEPFQLATGVTSWDMVVSNGQLFWVDQASPGHVWTCTVSTATQTCPVSSFSPPQVSPERITLGGPGNATLYWSDYGTGSTNNGSIMSLPLTGGTPSTVASNLWTPQGVAADATYVFWVQSYAPTTPDLTRLTLSNSSTTSLPTGSGSAPTAVGVGAGAVYWTDALTSGGSFNRSSENPLSLGTVTGSQAFPWAVSVDGTYVYWVDYSGTGSVWQYTIIGGSIQTIAPSENNPIRIVSDDAHAFWIDEGNAGSFNGKLVEWNASTASRVDRKTALNQPTSLAMDGNAVYFTTLGDNTLYMMVR